MKQVPFILSADLLMLRRDYDLNSFFR